MAWPADAISAGRSAERAGRGGGFAMPSQRQFAFSEIPGSPAAIA